MTRASWILLVLVGCGGSDNPPVVPDATTTDGSSPDAPSDGAVLRVHYPGATRITLRGDGPGLSWESGQDCAAAGADTWECVVDNVTDAFEAKPLVDDTTWARGSNWLLGPGVAIDAYPTFTSTVGRIVVHANIDSQFLDRNRDLRVWLPPSYDENTTKRYPVVIMHDGQNLFDAATAAFGVEWQIDEAMNHLVGTTGISEAIIVGVDNTADRIDEYTPTPDAGRMDGGEAPQYVRFLVEELRPMIEATYRTDGGKLGIAGSSLGGLVSLYACWTRSDVFDRCGVFSPSLWWDEKELASSMAADGTTVATRPLKIYLDSGDSGPSMDGMADTAAMRDLLVSKGFVLGAHLEYVLGVGHAHDEAAWAQRAPHALRWLLQDPTRAPAQ